MPIKTRSPRAARSRQVLTVDDMTGGLDLLRSQTLLGPSRSRVLRNFSLEEPGALVVRPGYQRVSTASLGSLGANGGQRVYLESTVFSLVAYDGSVYRPTDAWVWGAAVHSTVSTGNQVFFPYDRELVAVMDGANRPRFSTNGTNWLLMGITAPSSAATLSSASSGGLSSGEYGVAYAYKHRGTAFESNTSSQSTITLSGSTGAIHATASPSTDAKVDAYVWYARHVSPDGESVLRKVSSGAASTFTFTSTSWTSADEAATTHNPPAAGLRFAAIWKNRWWAADGTVKNRLRFTELFLNQAWPTNYYIDIPFEKGDRITALQPLGDTLLVYGESGIFLIIGQTSLDFEVRPSQGAETGAFGPRAALAVEQASIHAGSQGVNSFDGSGDRSLEHDIADGYSDLMKNSASADLEKVATVYDHQRQELRIAVPRVYPTSARGELVLNLDRTRENQGVPAWTTTDRDIALYMHWNGNEPTAGNRGRLFSMPSSAGVVFEENIDDVGANSSNLTAEYEGPALNLGLHRARVLDAHVEYEPNEGAASLETVTDGVPHGPYGLSIGTGLAAYDEATYDDATYAGTGRRKAYTLLPTAAEGRTIVTKLVYTGLKRFRIFTHGYSILPEGRPREYTE